MEPSKKRQPGSRSLSIVVIYPSPTVCHVLSTTLEREGHDVRSFLDPEEALSALLQAKADPMPDLLFLNIKSTSQLTEYDLLRQFRTYGPHMTVVVMCPPEDALIKLKAGLAGASSFLREPVQLQQVVALVQRLAMRPDTSTK